MNSDTVSIKSKNWSAYAAALTLGLTQSVLLASLPMLVAATGVDYSLWSWCLGATMFLYVIAAPLWGRRIDRRGAQGVHGQTALGTTLANLLLCIALFIPQPSVAFVLIVISRIGYALFASGLYPAAQTRVITATTAEQLQTMLGRLVAANHCGRLLGPVLVGAFAAYWFQLPVVVLVILGAWMTLSGFNPLSPSSPSQREGARGRGDNVRKATTPQSALSPLWPALLTAFIVTFSVGYLQFGLSFTLESHFALPPQQATQLLSQVLLLATVATLLTHLIILPRLKGRLRLQATAIAACLLPGSYLLMQNFSHMQLFAAIALLAIGHGLTSPAYTAWARNKSPATTGRMTATLMSVHTLGHGVGVVFAGALAGGVPIPVFSVLMVACVLQALMMLALLTGIEPASTSNKKRESQMLRRSA